MKLPADEAYAHVVEAVDAIELRARLREVDALIGAAYDSAAGVEMEIQCRQSWRCPWEH